MTWARDGATITDASEREIKVECRREINLLLEYKIRLTKRLIK
jgi:hypothetical protein